jgi:DNA-binding SARP family transcriptional activator
MRIRILGPLQVAGDGDSWRTLGAPKWRSLLACLVVAGGRPVTADELVDALWPSGAPRGATNQLHGYVMRVRRALGDQDASLLQTSAAGYQLLLGPDVLDADRFERLTSTGLAALRDANPDVASAVLGEALALWRGQPFADVPESPTVRARTEQLGQHRLTALEARIDADLALGRHRHLVAELVSLTTTEPFRERLWAQLMLALYRGDRQAEALDAYQTVRRILAEELGLSPGKALQDLHQQILRRDSELLGTHRTHQARSAQEQQAAAATLPVPRQLPADIADFTGRLPDLNELDGLLSGVEPAPGATGVCVITGTGGVGKTSLAVHWAHRMAPAFPDGQLFVNLRGYAPTAPQAPIEVLAQFLRALGLPPTRIPVHQDEAAALYRSTLADKRMLVVLDNAAEAEQIRPLLPGTPTCLVLVTSRDRLSALAATGSAVHHDLDRMPPAESVLLLRHILGARRVDAEADAASALATLCDQLPLALRITAANLATQPYVRLADHVEALRRGDTLQAMAIAGDTASSLSTALGLSYERLGQAERRLFRLASLLPGPDFTAAVAASLVETSVDDATDLLRALTTAHLLDQRGPTRYAYHDLVRLYARHRSGTEDGAIDQDAATSRLLGWYLHTASDAVRTVLPHAVRFPGEIAAVPPEVAFDGVDEASTWLDEERPCLLAVVRCAADRCASDQNASEQSAADQSVSDRNAAGQNATDRNAADQNAADQNAAGPPAWRFADVLRSFYFFRRHAADWLAVADVGLTSATAAGDVGGQAAAALSLAHACRCVSDYARAQEYASASVQRCREIGWPAGESQALNILAGISFEQGNYRAGVEIQEQVIALDKAAGDLEHLAMHEMNVALASFYLGRLQIAAEHLEQTVELTPLAESPQRHSAALSNLAAIYRWLGRWDLALDHLERALGIQQEARYDSALLVTHVNLANLLTDLGRIEEATTHRDAAATMAETMRSTRVDGCVLALRADVALAMDEDEDALTYAQRAVDVFREGQNRLELTDALLAAGTAHLRFGAIDPAYESAHASLETALGIEARAYEGRARTLLARVHLAAGRVDDAESAALQALAIHTETGHRPGMAHTLRLQGEIAARRGDQHGAGRLRHQGEALLRELRDVRGARDVREAREVCGTSEVSKVCDDRHQP